MKNSIHKRSMFDLMFKSEDPIQERGLLHRGPLTDLLFEKSKYKFEPDMDKAAFLDANKELAGDDPGSKKRLAQAFRDRKKAHAKANPEEAGDAPAADDAEEAGTAPATDDPEGGGGTGGEAGDAATEEAGDAPTESDYSVTEEGFLRGFEKVDGVADAINSFNDLKKQFGDNPEVQEAFSKQFAQGHFKGLAEKSSLDAKTAAAIINKNQAADANHVKRNEAIEDSGLKMGQMMAIIFTHHIKSIAGSVKAVIDKLKEENPEVTPEEVAEVVPEVIEQVEEDLAQDDNPDPDSDLSPTEIEEYEGRPAPEPVILPPDEVEEVIEDAQEEGPTDEEGGGAVGNEDKIKLDAIGDGLADGAPKEFIAAILDKENISDEEYKALMESTADSPSADLDRWMLLAGVK